MYTVQTYHRILYILVLWWNEPRTNETSWCYPKFLCLHLQHIFPANAKKLKVGDRRLLRDSNLNGLGVCSKVWCWKQDMSRWSHCRLTHGSLVRILFPLANGRLAHWAPFQWYFPFSGFPTGNINKNHQLQVYGDLLLTLLIVILVVSLTNSIPQKKRIRSILIMVSYTMLYLLYH